MVGLASARRIGAEKQKSGGANERCRRASFRETHGGSMQTRKWIQRFSGWLLMVVMAGWFSTTLQGQSASFTGRVTDPSGAVIPNAKITVQNQDNNAVRTTTTTAAGDYTVPYLSVGSYTVSVEAPGFKLERKTNIPLATDKVAVIDFKLQIGSVAQEVVVNSDQGLLDRGKADRGEIVENERVTELALNGRTPVMLDRLNSAVIWDGNLIWMRPFDGQTYTNLHINGSDVGGGASYSTEVMLDGAPNQTPRPQNTGHTDVSAVMPDDAVQDFKIVTNPYDSQYGKTRGGVIDMTVKSGTNRTHGDAYEYARRTWMDANTWFNDFHLADPTSGQNNVTFATLQHKLDQYGAELDGPVRFPKLYNGRDKTFFVMQYEKWNEIEPAYNVTSVPMPQWASGDFSNLTYAGAPVTLYDPTQTYACTYKGTPETCRQPFPTINGKTNQIPAGRLNATAVKLLSYFPVPNLAGNAGTPWQQNFYAPEPTIDYYRNALIKLDRNFSERDHASLRYGYWDRYETDSSNGIPTGPAFHGESPLADRSHNFAVQWTHTFSPTLLFDFRANVAVKAEVANTSPAGFDSTTLGWPNSLTSQLSGFSEMPGISPNLFTTLGGTSGNGYTTTDSLNLFPNMTWVLGKHTLHAGVDLRLNQYGVPLNASTDATLSFNQQWTQNCWNCSNGNDFSGGENIEGNSIASMLLGYASGGTATLATTSFYTNSYLAPYIQDDWKVTKKLTVNLGMRYDLQPYYVERHNRQNYAFDTTDVNPANAQLATHVLPTGLPFALNGGVTFTGVGGNPRQAYSTSYLDLQPRVGFAYSLNERTVVRGGMGEVFQNSDAFPIQNGYTQSTSLVNSPDGGFTPINLLSNPWATITQPTGNSLGLLTGVGGSLSYLNPYFSIPNVWQYSFGFERQFTKQDTLEVSYVGNFAPNNETSQNINHWNGNQEAACDIQLGGNRHICDDIYGSGNTSTSNSAAIYGYVTNPFYHIPAFQGQTPYGQTTRQALNWTEPFPEFGSITEYQWNGQHSWYNSLQLTGEHRMRAGLLLHGTYTWSKFMEAGGWADNNYLIPQRKIDNSDRPNAFTASGIYDLPVGRGKMLLGNTNRIVDTVAGGWEVTSLAIFQSGTPFTISGWDLVGNPNIKHAAIPGYTAAGNKQWSSPCYYTTNSETGAIAPTTFATQAGCTSPVFVQIPSYGAQPNIIYTGQRTPRTFLMDSGLFKNVSLAEGIKLQLRLETFNTLNHPTFNGGFYTGNNQYAGEIGAATGGGQSNKPRYTQIAAKIMW
jgi:hypothetical protein